MPLWCRHEWEVKAEDTVEPPLLKAVDMIASRPGYVKGLGMELFNMKNQETVHVVVLACSKCGKLKTIRTRAGERPW